MTHINNNNKFICENCKKEAETVYKTESATLQKEYQEEVRKESTKKTR